MGVVGVGVGVGVVVGGGGVGGVFLICWNLLLKLLKLLLLLFFLKLLKLFLKLLLLFLLFFIVLFLFLEGFSDVGLSGVGFLLVFDDFFLECVDIGVFKDGDIGVFM